MAALITVDLTDSPGSIGRLSLSTVGSVEAIVPVSESNGTCCLLQDWADGLTRQILLISGLMFSWDDVITLRQVVSRLLLEIFGVKTQS